MPIDQAEVQPSVNSGNDAFMSFINADVAANDDAPQSDETTSAPTPAPASVQRPPAISSRSKSAAVSNLPPRPHHNRNVSFGHYPPADGHIAGVRSPLMASGLQLPISPGSSGGLGVPAYRPGFPTGSSTHSNEPSAGDRKRPILDRQAISMRLRQAAAAPPAANPAVRVSLEDLLGQGRYESEAETNLLAAFEAHQKNNLLHHHHRSISNTSTIFSGVPSNLSQELVVGESGHSANPDDTDNIDLRDGSFKSQDSDSHILHGSGHPRIGSTNTTNEENLSLLNENDENARSANDKSHRNIRPKRLSNKAYSHRRMMSVEDQLAGLQYAMSAFQETGGHDLHDETHDGIEGVEDSSKAFDEPWVDASAGELFSHHAGLLLEPGIQSGRHRLNTSDGTHLPTLEEETPQREHRNSADLTSRTDSPETDVENPMDERPTDETTENLAGSTNGHGKKKSRPFRIISSTSDKVKDDLDAWRNFFSPRSDMFWVYVKRMLFYIVLPFVLIAAILFYFAENPPTGRSENNDPGEKASASWWLLFVVRQVVTFSIGLGLQSFIIDFLCVGTRLMVRCMGPILTLLIVQAKGWPFVMMMWGLVNFGLLFGDNEFVRHWGYFQGIVDLLNSSNPSGGVVGSDWNRRVLLIMICVGFTVALKRFLVGLYLGRQTFNHFGAQLAKVMNKMVLVAEVAQLSRRIERSMTMKDYGRDLPSRMKSIKDLSINLEEDNDSVSSERKTENVVIDTSKRNPLTGSLLSSERMKLLQLLERWEEPERETAAKKHTSISSVLKFRNALTFINNVYPFSYQFGLADTREHCIESAQDVYAKLILERNGTESQMLRFETLALIALSSNGQIDQAKAKDLVRVFRPDRQGNLSVLDFIKSVDIVYKEFRFLQASIENSSQIDKSFENLVNVVFYAIVISFILSQLGFDPFSLFLSLSSVVLAFAFAIGSASAKYFEGLLFILVRRPYGIGDLIHVSNIESGTVLEGSVGWTVNNVTLFETEMTWLPTMERCSVSNGSLANSRIINWARSPNARFVMFLIFPIETPYETLEIFKVAVEEYLKARPREWLALNAFRVNYLQGEKAWMRIEVVIQHRESWQNVGTILDSKGNFMSYCTEIQKMLGIQYKAPHLPIEMSIGDRNRLAQEFLVNDRYHSPENDYRAEEAGIKRSESGDLIERSNNQISSSSNQQGEMFRSLAQTKYNIRV
ncbi:mechanosensitive ion channel [Nitzschia inconspicua]|uniref:Mechanosensitive ion channel n=1 Tax=Nitzschia inconspicua TaxID=303405 RepID=A0A9K3M5D6_9STRA|nr:mechanosensitive ion channel [Nitzschia inconspicua]